MKCDCENSRTFIMQFVRFILYLFQILCYNEKNNFRIYCHYLIDTVKTLT